jgi:predicted type IV restriction endonuclease
MNADYAIVTDGDLWQVYRLEKADKIELICE